MISIERYYLVKILTNTEGTDASTVSVYQDKESALVAYHNTLAAFHNAPDVYYAVVESIGKSGYPEISETVFHPIPDEPEEENTEPEGE